MIRLLLHLAGLDDASGPFYLFWSGIGSGFSIVTILVVLAAKVRNKIEKIEIHHHHHHYGSPQQEQTEPVVSIPAMEEDY